MTVLKDSIEIRAPPKKVFDFFEHLVENYKRWHPSHTAARWIKGKGMEPGAVAFMEEELHGKMHRFRSRITEVERNKRIVYKNMFQVSIVSPWGSFEFERKGKNTVFTAKVSVRFGFLFSIFAKNRVESLRAHMREEGENLKNILENS